MDGSDRRRQFQLGLFCSAMVAMAQRLDARSLFFRPQLSISTFLALVLKICRNRFSCHSQNMPELTPSKLSTFGHSVTIRGSPRRGGGLEGFVSLYPTLEPEQSRGQEPHMRASGVGTPLLLLKLHFLVRLVS